MLETTVAGSLPKPAWLAEPEKGWAGWRLEGDELEQGKRDATLLRIKEQEDAGIDVATEEVETPEKVADTLKAAMEFVEPERTFPCTNCGLAPLPRDVSIAKIRALGAGARLARRHLKSSRKTKSGKESKGGKSNK